MAVFNQLSIEDRLTKSRVQLLMHYPFFGTLALHLKLVERKDDKSLPTAATDGRNYYYNPDFVGKLEEAEVNFLTAHETLHPALGHLWRRGTRNPVIWNHAADYCINGMILECDPTGKDFKMIKGGLFDKKFTGMYSEEIYDILIRDEEYVKNAMQQAAQGNGGTLDNHDSWDDPNSGDGNGDDEGGSASSGNSEEDWKGRVVQASQVAEGKGKGKLPAAIRRLVDELIAPQKNWKEELADFVQFEVNDYGWSPPNSHHLWRDIYLPDFSEVTENVENILFCIDTSGSITKNHMTTFISEVVGCMNQFSGKVKGHLMYIDARVQAVYDLEDAENSVPKGGGGTDFRPAFKWVEENLDTCAGVVFLTDGWGDYPSEQPNYPVLWVLTEEYNTPWGRKTRIKI